MIDGHFGEKEEVCFRVVWSWRRRVGKCTVSIYNAEYVMTSKIDWGWDKVVLEVQLDKWLIEGKDTKRKNVLSLLPARTFCFTFFFFYLTNTLFRKFLSPIDWVFQYEALINQFWYEKKSPSIYLLFKGYLRKATYFPVK